MFELGKFIRSNHRLLIITCLLLLILTVRLYYFSGPLYVLGDEGIYLNIFSQTLIFHNSVPLSMHKYANANFSNVTQDVFNPANVFSFYSGFLYPEIAFMKVVGYSAGNAIYYIVFCSVVEGLFLFLILEMISNVRAATIGGLLFAFFPLDVTLSLRIVPVIPMAMMLTIAVYVFLRGEKSKKMESKSACMLLSGFFVGLAYLTHPEGIILLPFLLLYLLIPNLRDRKKWVETGGFLVLILVGAFLAFSISGFSYLVSANNFFLYPMVDHNVFLYQFAGQSHYNVTIGSVVLTYTTGKPLGYVNFLLRSELTQNVIIVEHNTFYFSIIGYLAIAFSVFLLFRGKGRYQRMFVYMFVFFLLALSLLPTSVMQRQGKLILLMVNSDAIYASALTMSTISIVALSLDMLLSDKNRFIIYLAVGLILACTLVSIAQLNYDFGVYRSTMYDVHAFVNYLGSHSSEVFYTQSVFAQEVQDITGYKYFNNVKPLFNCSNASAESSNNTYFVTGGTLSISWAPGVMEGYDSCVQQSLPDANVVYNVSNPYQAELPLRVLSTN